MADPYPQRERVADVIRYACMLFGALNGIGAVFIGFASPEFVIFAPMGLFVAGAWFAFGTYGGTPLVDTVSDWHRPQSADAIDDSHLRGLRVIRRRRISGWVASLAVLPVVAVLMPIFERTGHPELAIVVALPLFFIVGARG